MLHLNRKAGETVVVRDGDDTITIRIVSTHGQSARIGIHAPREVPIVREELLEDAEDAPPE